jgi:hypothetical protein
LQTRGLCVGTAGLEFTANAEVTALHPVLLFVKVKVTPLPAAIPFTSPALVTVATNELLLAHVPPFVGVTLVVAPTQIADVAKLTTGNAFTVNAEVVALHPVMLLVKVKVTPLPAAMPETSPASVTVATDGLLLVHVPPLDGVTLVVAPTQIADVAKLTTGNAVTDNAGVVALQPVVLLVKVKVTPLPTALPVTTPALFTEATVELLLVHVPPLDGVTFVVAPIQIADVGKFTTGNAFTDNAEVVDLHPVLI